MNHPHFDASVFPVLAAKVNKKYDMDGPNGCWTWLGTSRLDGAGVVGLPSKEFGYKLGAKNKYAPRVVYAHRAVMMLLLGRELDPETERVEHTCGFRACGNPDHLNLVTIKRKQQ